VLIIGNNKRTKSDANKAIKPINLFGIDLRIAYEGKKYHSGTMCSGVTIGLPSI